MSDLNKHINYTGADIEKYHQGLMNPAERHALEKAALDDPFLADALDGYAEKTDHEKNLSELKNKLAERISESETSPVIPMQTRFSWWRVAALIVLIAGAGLLVYQFSFNKNISQNSEIAKTSKEEPSPEISSDTNSRIELMSDVNDSAGATEQNKVQLNFNKLPNEPEVKNVEIAKIKNEISTNSPVRIQETASVEDKLNNKASGVKVIPEQTDEAIIQGKVASNEEFVTLDTVSVQSYPKVASQKRLMSGVANREKLNSKPVNLFYYTGKVIDENNNPLPFVYLWNPKNKLAIQSDKNGLFSFSSSDSIPILIASAVGYAETKQALQKNPGSNTITLLKSEAELSEVVVTGYGNNKNKEIPFDIDEQAAAPVNGWKDFNNYVKDNKKTFAADDPNREKGRVTLSFDIDATKRPANIVVIKSLNDYYDKEATRLLLEGPDWLKSTNGAKARVTIKF